LVTINSIVMYSSVYIWVFFKKTDGFIHGPVWKAENAAVGFDVLTTCQPSTIRCSRERLPAAAAQPAQGLSEPVAPRIYLFIFDGFIHSYLPTRNYLSLLYVKQLK
jgi:hypothetical protein